jgi:hypothetical protein
MVDRGFVDVVSLFLGLRGWLVAIAASYAGGIAGRAGSTFEIPYGLLTLYAKKSPIEDEQTNEIAKKGNLAILLSPPLAREAAV